MIGDKDGLMVKLKGEISLMKSKVSLMKNDL